MFFIQCFFLLLLTSFSSSKLEMVLEVFRHGAREPLGVPYDPYDWTELEGELTPAGMRQHYLLGKAMRKRYIEDQSFLSKTFNHSEIYVRSTDVNRTIMSAQSHLLGLYPLGTGVEFPNDYPLERAVPPFKTNYDVYDLGFGALPGRYQPIPVHVVENEEDVLLVPGDYCPNYGPMCDRQKESALYQVFNQRFSPFLQKVAQIFNISNNITISNVSSLTSDLHGSFFQNDKFPDGLTKEIFLNMSRIKDLEVQFLAVGTEEQKKLLSTAFLKKLMEYFRNKIENSDYALKFVALSAHDTTLQPFIAALNLTSWECILDQIEGRSINSKNKEGNCVPGYPVFASQLLFELHSEESYNERQFFVKVLYNGEEMKLCEREEKICLFEEFKRRIYEYVFSEEDFEKICGGETKLGTLKQ